MKYKTEQEEVLRATGQTAIFSRSDILTLSQKAALTKRRRIRICVHRDDKDVVQEMFIVHTNKTYIRPHKHLTKKESLHIIQGKATIVLFTDKGRIKDVVKMGDFSTGLPFYLKTEKPVYHSMLITSAELIFLEITNGPFRRNETVFAPWAPDGSDAKSAELFRQKIKRDADKFLTAVKSTS